MFGDKRRLVFKQEAKDKLKKGIDTVADAVSTTLGPNGKNVILHRIYNKSIITKDGVSVARDIFLEDPVEDIGAQLVKEAAEKTAELAGDGTTTATILARKIYTECLKEINRGYKSNEIKKGIEKGLLQLVNKIKENSFPIEDLKTLINIAIISTNGDEELGQIIGETVYKIGINGAVLQEDSKTENTYSEIIKGTIIEKGFISPHFITGAEDTELVLDNPIILVTNTKVSNAKELQSFFEYAYKNNKSFLIIMEELDKMALSYAIENINTGKLKGAIVSPPGVSNMRQFMLEDIAILTGAKFIDRFRGNTFDRISIQHFGSAHKVIVNRKKTIITGGKGDKEKIEARKKSILKNIEDAEKNIDVRHKDRLSKMFSGIATIYVGGTTEVEQKERKDRVDDAVRATQSALDEGYLPGGGIALYKLSKELDYSVANSKDELIGMEILTKSCSEPLNVILSNGNKSFDVISNEINKIKGINCGYNARTEMMSKNLIKDGIIDPTKVTRVAIENAVSISTLLCNTDCIIYYKDNQHESIQIDPGNVR